MSYIHSTTHPELWEV